MTDTNTAFAAYPSFVIDCPDPAELATFYSRMLGWTVKDEGDWAEIRPDDNSDCIGFQQVANYRAPEWPGQQVPQQMHLDLMVQDLDEGEKAVTALGATKPDHQPGTSFRVFLDLAGHPFCLCVS
jgi:predicted enzyme related to lactoylglutathione lyase